jgi:hypothetical protein
MTVTNTRNRLKYLQKNITAKALIDVGFPIFLKHTPVKSGNAVKHTTKNSSEINANYPYAKRLDEGYSHQSSQGMVKPTIDAMRAYIKKTLGV